MMRYHTKTEVTSSEEVSAHGRHYYSTVSQSLTANSPSQELHFYDQLAKDRDTDSSVNYAFVVVNKHTAVNDTKNKNSGADLSSTTTANAAKSSLQDARAKCKDVGDGDHNLLSRSDAEISIPPVIPVKSELATLDVQTDTGGTTNTSNKIYASSSAFKSNSKVVVRPIAFKPVVPSKRSGCSPERSSFTPISYDDGYSSQGTSRGCSNSASTFSRDSDTFYASPIHTSNYHPDFQVIPIQHEDNMQSDNIDYETLLQEKESEISKLRRTMELNESAIVRVHEQRKVEWENQMKDLTEEYHRRLRIQQEHAQDRHTDLQQTIAQLEIDNRQLSVDVQQNQIDKDRQDQMTTQLHELKQRNSDLSHRLTQESCDSDILRHKNKELETKTRKLQEQLSLGTAEQERLKERLTEMGQLENDSAPSMKLKQLNQRLEQQEKQIQQDREKFRSEQERWQDEKEKVLQYQKQLQRTYVQMYRRNNELEQQLCRINSRRQARRESHQHSINNADRYSLLNVDLETTPESFC